ncbi:MAG: isoleucine--tRNA ligase [Oceanococcaceae bacterium]
MSRFAEIKPSAFNAGALEQSILDWWAEEKIFERQLGQRPEAPRFTFYEGPPTANGRPGVHHVLARTIKDSFCRYKAMCGYQVQRKAGWDTHGLPVEIEVEKKLGLKNRAEIEAYGIAEYNKACRESVNQYTALWNELTTRIGYWVDLDQPYVTYDNNYIESVWWLLKQLADKDLLYRGHKIHWYSPGTGTVLSSHEVSLGYKEVDDPSVTVRFAVEGEEKTYFLAWTTTPWTLPSNLLLAVGAELDYLSVECEGEKLILAKALAGTVLDKREYTVLAEHKGRELVGMRYRPVFDWFADHPGAFRVVAADYVTTEDGTGIVHTAPAFGADDFATGQREGVEMVNPVERDGHFRAGLPLVGGMWFKEADKEICRELKERGLLFARTQYRHNYPHDWRKGTPLMSYPVESWFVRTTAFKDRLVALNNSINWQPQHVGKGRFGEWLSNNVDWALSRHRFWGTPLPIWVNDQNPEDYVVIGSVADLKAHVPADQWPGEDSLDLHRPMVDDFSWPAADGGTYRRVPEIIDVWFDSGAMPFAQWHYPFENQQMFEQSFPADFIAEGLDQTRGWFYTLHAIATLVKDSVAYKNVVVNGLLLDEKGEKMSKSKGNTVDPFEAVAEHGADALRWYLMAASPPWDNVKYSDAGVLETRRKLFMTLVNVYGFFATYANIDGADPAKGAPLAAQRPELDRWLLSRLQTTIGTCREALDAYNPTRAARAIETLVDDLSNWYIRRSRPVFWAGKKDTGVGEAEKRAAYATTYEVLLAISQLMAPIAPFFAEWLHRSLCRDQSAEASVHLADYPQADAALVDTTLEARIDLARRVVSTALQLRNTHKLGVRQPLSKVIVVTEPGVSAADLELVSALIREEVNVDALETVEAGSGIVSRSAKPNFRVVGKKAGPKMKLVAAACAQIDDAAIQAYTDQGQLRLSLSDGSEFVLEEGDLLIESQGLEGWAVAREDGVTVALDTQLDDALLARGLAREVINRIQSERKRLDLDVTARIRVLYTADPKLGVAIHAHRDLIMKETLALALDKDAAEQGASFDIDGASLQLQLQVEA